MMDLLEQAVQVLAARCDGARYHDDAGYNATDAAFGHALATVPADAWTPALRRHAWEMLGKYRVQLARYGLDFAAIPVPPRMDRMPAREVRACRLLEQNGAGRTFALSFPYNPSLVNAVRLVPGRKWDGTSKEWRVPATIEAVNPLLALLIKNNFAITPEARGALQALHDLAAEAVERGELEEVPAAAKNIVVDGEYFAIRFPYDRDMVDQVRLIDGRKWDGKKSRWLVPLVQGERVRAFGERHSFHMDAATLRIAKQATQEIDERYEASRAADAEIVIPGFGGTPYPFQRAGIKYALEVKRCFVADDMGLGKTIQALGVAQAANAFPLAVACPASLKLNWAREARRWLPGKRVLVCTSQTTESELRYADVIIANYDILKVEPVEGGRKGVTQPTGLLSRIIAANPQMVVLDESHMIKSNSARRSKACRHLGKGREYRLCLSGTPLTNKPAEMVTQLQFLDRLGDVGGYQNFMRRWGWMQARAGYEPEGLLALNKMLRGICYVRRLKADVLKELPAKQRSTVPLSLSNRKEYDYAESQLIQWLRETASDAAEANRREWAVRRAEQLVRINALRQLTARGKLDQARAWIQDFIDGGEKLVVFGWHDIVVSGLADHFKAPKITGSTPLDARQRAVDQFQTDPDTKLILLNIKAGGVGLTLTAASNVAFVELAWTPADLDQAEDRTHRIGQLADSVNAWYLLAERTIDDMMMDLIDEKRTIFEAAAEGRVLDAETEQTNMLDALVKRMIGADR